MTEAETYFRFLNLQYWYCVIYSLLGGKCTDVEGGTIGTASTTPAVTATTPSAHLDFWHWLFGGDGNVLVSFFHTFSFLAPVVAFIGAILAVLWGIYSLLAYTAAAALAVIILGAGLGLLWIRYEELSMYSTLPPQTETSLEMRSRWQQLLDRAMSANPRDWRESILAADELLGEMLLKLGYHGVDTHARLRAVPEGAFVTLPNAWEAHRIRNFVVSKISNYILTQREAFRVMKLYEQVFEEFDFI